MANDIQRDTLQREIDKYVKRGFIVMSQTDTSAQLVKKKKFNWLAFILLLGVFYLIYYWTKRDQSVYITVSADGKVTKR